MSSPHIHTAEVVSSNWVKWKTLTEDRFSIWHKEAHPDMARCGLTIPLYADKQHVNMPWKTDLICADCLNERWHTSLVGQIP